ncbi:MAG: type II secretion system F family protein [Verrucomicrobiia bacterium]|jgi:type II secretory pathway component PulF
MEPLLATNQNLGVLPFVLGGGAVMLLITLLLWVFATLRRPLRERHEAEVLLDIISDSINDQTAVEHRITQLAESEDSSLGGRFEHLADNLKEGQKLDQAIEDVPGVLPPEVKTMLLYGLRNNALAAVMGSCQQRLQDTHARYRAAMSVIAGGGIGVQFVAMIMVLFIVVFIRPKFEAIMNDMAGSDASSIAPIFHALDPRMLLYGFGTTFCLGLVVLWMFAGLIPSSGIAELMGKSPFGKFAWSDRIFSWKRLRLTRDFSSLLAAFLDAGMPEAEAVRRAADAVNHSYTNSRAKGMLAAMEAGDGLLTATNSFEGCREFQWRYRNAAKAGGNYGESLAGWHASLESLAYYREQRCAEITTAILIVLNGALVGLFAAGIFQFLAHMIERMAM